MIEWLQNFSGLKSTGPNMERIELDNLRKEMSKYKKKYAKEDEEMEVHSQSEVLYLSNFRMTKKRRKNKIKSISSSKQRETRQQERANVVALVLKYMDFSTKKKILNLESSKRQMNKKIELLQKLHNHSYSIL